MYRILLLSIIVLSVFLRLSFLSQNPPSLYWDEVSLGYNAYSILTSGIDEHGEPFPLDRFIAFGDYKPPGYIYAAVPSLAWFGVNEVGVRFPSALAGILMTGVTYLLVVELFRWRKLALLASFLTAISPWSLHLSRGAFEANLAALFHLLGIYLFLLSQRRGYTLVFSIIMFVLSFYTFNANRVIAPLMLLVLFILYHKVLWRIRGWVILSGIVGMLMILPSMRFLLDRESKLRFDEVSIFTALDPVVTANERINRSGNTALAKIINNRRVLFAGDFLKHYTDNFSGRFLFTHGDRNPRLHVQDMGQLYVIELPFLTIGAILLVKKRTREAMLLFLWMLIVPIPAGMARETPHALRIVSILPTYQIIIALGVLYTWNFFKKRKYSSVVLSAYCILLTANVYYYLHHYYIHYPVEWSGEWQYGYKEMVQYIARHADQYDHIIITDRLSRAYVNTLFYSQYPVEHYVAQRKASRDWYGFWTVTDIGKIRFYNTDMNNLRGRILSVETPQSVPAGFARLEEVKNLKGETVFVIAEKRQ